MNKLLWIALSIGLSTQLLSATSTQPLSSGKAIDGTVKQKEKKYYNITVPKNKSVRVNLTGLEADVDLYVKKGNEVRVRFNDCYSANSNTESEECVVTNEGESSIYTIMVNGFKASAYNLKATVEGAEEIPTLTSDPIADAVQHKEGKQYKLDGKKGETITVTLSDLTADADLRVRVGRKAGLHSFNCKSNNGGTKTEECVITPKKDATVYVHVYGYQASNYSLKAVQGTTNPCISRDALNNKLLHHEDVTDVNTSCITDMSRLSYYMDEEFNQDLSNWDVSNVTNMEEMFAGGKDMGKDMRGIEIISVGSLSKWNVSKVTNMRAMFYGYYRNIGSLRISNWDTSNVTNMENMFQRPWNDKHLNLVDISNWNVEKVDNHKNFFPKTVDNKQPKWKDGNIDSELINLAKEHCLNQSNSSKDVLCSYQKDKVFIIKSKNLGYQKEYKLYKVDIATANENVSLLDSYTGNGPAVSEGDSFFPTKRLNSPYVFLINNREGSPDWVGNISLVNFSGKTLISFRYEEEQQHMPSIEATDQGKKVIVIESQGIAYDNPIRTRKVYDISNPNEAKLISEENI